MKHKHLTLQDRYHIEISLKSGSSQIAIAKALETTQGTISKEIKRNAGLKPFKEFVKTITFDNGKELAKHKDMADSLGCDTYFAKLYHSWERGKNEIFPPARHSRKK